MENKEKELWLKVFDQTGFDLEYRIQQILRNHNWHVMNSRYYVDDKTGAEREIDIVAYKRKLSGDIACYTYLIVSCKKASKSSWVFLTTDMDTTNEEFDPCPVEIVASEPGIQNLINREKSLAVKLLMSMDIYRKISDTPHKVLAFQQFHRESHRPEDDKRIFDSIITTIKAANYERKYALAHKCGRTQICLNFNLLSVFEGGLKENYHNGSTNELTDITEIKYINRHIIDDTDRFYRVHFIDSNAFEEILTQYDQAAECLPDYYSTLQNEFYQDIFCEKKKHRLKPFWDDFKDELFREMYEEGWGEDDQDYYNNSWLTSYQMDTEKSMLLLYWDMSMMTEPEQGIQEMNKNKRLLEKTVQKLKTYFYYDGAFMFVLEPHPQFDW